MILFGVWSLPFRPFGCKKRRKKNCLLDPVGCMYWRCYQLSTLSKDICRSHIYISCAGLSSFFTQDWKDSILFIRNLYPNCWRRCISGTDVFQATCTLDAPYTRTFLFSKTVSCLCGSLFCCLHLICVCLCMYHTLMWFVICVVCYTWYASKLLPLAIEFRM